MKKPRRKKTADISGSNRTGKEVKAAEKAMTSLLAGLKNYALYPADHLNCQRSAENVKTCMDEFLKNRDRLRVYVKKSRLLFQGRTIHQELPGKSGLASLLFRDGITWLEFQRGIELREIIGFFNILKKYRFIEKEPEGDIVTALWDENFPHLCYEAKEIDWDTEPLTDDTFLNCHKKRECTGEKESGQDEEKPPSSIADLTDRSLWQLTPEEIRTLRKMVWTEENLEGTSDVLELLVVILEEQHSEADFKNLLDFLKEKFQDTLEQGEFSSASEFLKHLHHLRSVCKTGKPWASSLINHFFKEISEPQFLNVLQQIRPGPDAWDSKQLKSFGRIFRFLSPEAVETLCPMVFHIHSSRIRRLFTAIIISLAKRDIRPLERLLDHPEDAMLRGVIHILEHLGSRKAEQLLIRMTCHSSEKIRKEAFKALLDHNPQIFTKLFYLIEDFGDGIRQMMLNHLSHSRNEQAEDLLLDYLENRRFKRTENNHILACYRALGRCGSSLSVPFLQNTLMSRGWKSVVGADKTLERQGAAIALAEMKTGEADEILKKASESLFPGIKLAYQKALKQ